MHDKQGLLLQTSSGTHRFLLFGVSSSINNTSQPHPLLDLPIQWGMVEVGGFLINSMGKSPCDHKQKYRSAGEKPHLPICAKSEVSARVLVKCRQNVANKLFISPYFNPIHPCILATNCANSLTERSHISKGGRSELLLCGCTEST